jgi:hypothetical protein
VWYPELYTMYLNFSQTWQERKDSWERKEAARQRSEEDERVRLAVAAHTQRHGTVRTLSDTIISLFCLIAGSV